MRHLALPATAALLVGLSLGAHDASAQLPTENLPLIGTSGGAAFTRNCPNDHILTGVRVRLGAIIDAIGIKCRSVQANGTLGGEVNVGALAGGTGGLSDQGSCPAGSVIVAEAGQAAAIGVAQFELECRAWNAAARRWQGGVTAVIRALAAASAANLSVSGAGVTISGHQHYARCANDTQPVVGIRGRSGAIVDAVGVQCNEP